MPSSVRLNRRCRRSIGPGAWIDQPARHQLGQHAREALLRDAQNAQQLADGHAGVAADEVHGPVVRPSETEFGQHRVGGPGEVAIGEEHQVLRESQILLAEEQRTGSGIH